jgi:hypothetical protein
MSRILYANTYATIGYKVKWVKIDGEVNLSRLLLGFHIKD